MKKVVINNIARIIT